MKHKKTQAQEPLSLPSSLTPADAQLLASAVADVEQAQAVVQAILKLFGPRYQLAQGDRVDFKTGAIARKA